MFFFLLYIWHNKLSVRFMNPYNIYMYTSGMDGKNLMFMNLPKDVLSLQIFLQVRDWDAPGGENQGEGHSALFNSSDQSVASQWGAISVGQELRYERNSEPPVLDAAPCQSSPQLDHKYVDKFNVLLLIFYDFLPPLPIEQLWYIFIKYFYKLMGNFLLS